jgi:hypothetical protein
MSAPSASKLLSLTESDQKSVTVADVLLDRRANSLLRHQGRLRTFDPVEPIGAQQNKVNHESQSKQEHEQCYQRTTRVEY